MRALVPLACQLHGVHLWWITTVPHCPLSVQIPCLSRKGTESRDTGGPHWLGSCIFASWLYLSSSSRAEHGWKALRSADRCWEQLVHGQRLDLGLSVSCSSLSKARRRQQEGPRVKTTWYQSQILMACFSSSSLCAWSTSQRLQSMRYGFQLNAGGIWAPNFLISSQISTI